MGHNHVNLSNDPEAHHKKHSTVSSWHYYRHHHHTISRLFRGSIWAILCVALVVIIIILGIAILITYLILHPHATRYTIVSAQVQTLSVTQGSSIANVDITYGIYVENPNGRVGMDYDKFHVQTTFLGTVALGECTVPGFFLGHRAKSTFSVQTNSGSAPVNEATGILIQAGINQQSVPLVVRIDAHLHAKIGSYTSFGIWVHSECDITVSPPSGNAEGILLSRSCRIVH